MTKFFDAMSQQAPLGPTQPTAKRPSSVALGFQPSDYFNNSYFGTSAGVVDVAKAKEIGNCLQTNATAMFDFETWLGKCATYGSLLAPAPDRLVYQSAVAKTMGTVKGTARGATNQYMPYQSILGLGAHDFGTAWINAYIETNRAIFLEPVEGAPDGIGNLFQIKLVSVYRRYMNFEYDSQRIAWLASMLRAVYPGAKICAAVSPRLIGVVDAGARRYDYMTRAEMTAYLAVALANFDDVAIWNSNHYGPEGTPLSQRNGIGYAIVPGTTATINGEGWNENAGWWQAVKDAMQGRRVDTIQYNQSGGSQSPGIRTR